MTQPLPSEIDIRATFAKMEKWIERFENGACNAMQILNVVRGEWKEANSWSEWDESVWQEMVALQKDIAALAPYLKPQFDASPKTITIHVEGGMVQDVTGIPAGVEVRVEDYDHSDDTQPTWDAEKGCHVTVYGGAV